VRVSEVLRLAAFTDTPSGGNPAGVVLDARGWDDARMQAVAAEVGYSETAFVVGGEGDALDVRYFSPVAEVPFCGHATIATGVALGDGDWRLMTAAGLVTVAVDSGVATLTSVEPRTEDLAAGDLSELLAAIAWDPGDLDPALPPRVGYAGAFHPIIAAATRERLAHLDYDFDRLLALMQARNWTTVALVHRREADVFDARDPFPVGGVVEDPATGAAAAAFGGYLRELELVEPPAEVTIHQGDDMGRPSLLRLSIGISGGIAVGGRAVAMS
jgi:PhzF family phenazine biosynthesis protein